jgi:hypothetical protein
MCHLKRLLLFAAAVSFFVAASAASTWIFMSRHDTFLPLGDRWVIAGRADRDEFNFDQGGWSPFAPHANGGGFFPDGFNATLTLQRDAPSDGWSPSHWPERTVGGVRVRNVVVLSAICSAALVFAAVFVGRSTSRPSFPITHPSKP